MSGPKSGSYYIDSQRRQLLNDQIRRSIEREKAALAEKKKQLEELKKKDEEKSGEQLRRLGELKQELGDMYEELIIYQKEHNQYVEAVIVNSIKSLLYPEQQVDSHISLQQQLSHLEGLRDAARRELDRQKDILEESARNGKTSVIREAAENISLAELREKTALEQGQDSRLMDFASIIPEGKAEEISRPSGGSMTIVFGEGSKEKAEGHENIIFGKNGTRPKRSGIEADAGNAAVIGELREEYLRISDLLDIYLGCVPGPLQRELLDLKKSLNAIMSDERLTAANKLYQIKLRKEAFLLTRDKYDSGMEDVKKLRVELEDLQNEYEALCGLLGEEPEKMEKSSLSPEAEKELLEKRIGQKREALSKEREASYISESINEVMAELGYDIVASDYMSTPKRNIIHNLYDFGDRNILNVYASDNGSVMFEVTGIKEKEELTSMDKLRIKEGMDRFCPQYQKIKEALALKGITICSENLLPADVRYARTVDVEEKRKSGDKRASRRRNNNKVKYEQNSQR